MSKCQFYNTADGCKQININRIPKPGQQKYCKDNCSNPCNTDKDCSNTPGPSPPPPNPPPPNPPPPNPPPPNPPPPNPPPPNPPPPNPPPSTTCNSFPWSKNNKVNNVEKASAFMRNAVNEYGCFKNNHVVAAEEGGMKGEGWNGTTSTLKCMCPYGMTYNEESNNEYISEIIGNNCVDVKSIAQDCKNNIMGQCLDKKEPYDGKLENIYLTWFWWPNLPQQNLLDYINTQIHTCHAMASGGKTNGVQCAVAPVNGLCFPLTAWPDQNNNLSFLFNEFKSKEPDHNRQLLGDWMYSNLFTNINLKKDNHTINPGLLLYISFKDGPWVNFYPDAKTKQTLVNPITGKPFGTYKDWDGNMGTGSQWVWGAFFHFMQNYVCKDENGATRKLPKNFWLHLDKEGSQSNDTGFTQQMYTDATQYFIGNLIEDFEEGDKILYLATGVDGGGALAPKKEYFTLPPKCPDNSTNWCNKNNTSISVPEYYWGVGNQMPCDGSAGSYNYARTACTSLSSHRRLAGYPKQYVDLITGGDGPTNGSDCKHNGWLGNGDWASATKDANKNPSIWPSFSIENLSMCDTNNPNCYNQFTIEKNKLGKNDKSDTEGLSYTGEWGENTTICNSMIWGSLLEDGKNQPLSQGMKSCGVFDGFSYWHWNDFVNFMHYFANQYKTPNLIIYEASFIPYHWLQTLGITNNAEKTGFPNKQSALLPKPAIPDREIGCAYYKQGSSCKSVDNGITGTHCDPACITACGKDRCKSYFSKQCGYNNNWKPGPNPKPTPPGPNPKPTPPGPNPKPTPPGPPSKSENLPIIIIGTIVGISLIALIVYLLYRHFKANKK